MIFSPGLNLDNGVGCIEDHIHPLPIHRFGAVFFFFAVSLRLGLRRCGLSPLVARWPQEIKALGKPPDGVRLTLEVGDLPDLFAGYFGSLQAVCVMFQVKSAA